MIMNTWKLHNSKNHGADTISGDTVAIKNGKSVVVQKMVRDQWHMNCGKLIGDVKEIIKTVELLESQKEAQLAQAILVRFYTVPHM
jgi:hypothetical protein